MPRVVSRALLCALCLWVSLAARAQQPPKLNVKTLKLANGLTVLALEDRALPSVAFYVLYKVGSRNERPGITGLSHLFEHMMFNGSARFKPKEFDAIIEAGGGYSNAFTTSDTTEYYEEFSSGTLDKVLQMEADRMRALRVDRQNLEQERGIVQEERRVNTDNSPAGAMSELLWNTAYAAHPYRWDTIGFMKDLDAIRVEDARAYFRLYYAPNNAVIAVVGDFDAADLFAKVRRHFGPIPRQPAPPAVVNAEPPQRGERRSLLHFAAELPAVTLGYHTIPYKHPDDPALDALSLILAGGESSRLYRDLVYEKRIATEVSAANESRLDPGLFTFYAQAQQGHTAEELEKAIYAALDDVAKNGVTARELQKARNALRVAYLDRFTTNYGRAGLLADYQANRGDWRKALAYLPRYDKLTPEDIRRVARKYFSDRSRAVVTLIPENPNPKDTKDTKEE